MVQSTIEPFRIVTSVAVPIDIANCDTDQIIPARFLRKAADDPNYPKYLMHDLRFNPDGTLTEFILNQESYEHAQIIVADINWGCGSSRENAVTALVANGIRAVIAPSIADIHYANCVKNGVLPIQLPREVCDRLRRQLHESPEAEIAIDLETQSLTGPDQAAYTFEIEACDKHRLLNGLDDISLTMEHADAIDEFAERKAANQPWTQIVPEAR
jgi:3-isopropylmalate/(R)-2-methylmalate dehydratase small subunit